MQKAIDITQKPTEEQLAMLMRAAKNGISADSEYPEFSEEELKQFRRISEQRQSERRKQTVTLRLSPQALAKAKSLGKGYTTVLSRILETALDNTEIVKKYF